jgi:cytochrome c556
MTHSKARRAAGAALVTLFIGTWGTAQIAQAQSPTPADKAIEYRQAVFKVVAGNFGPLAQSAQGKIELPAGAARKYAERLAAISEFTRDAFPEISREGGVKTKAKPEIWSDRAEFGKLLDDFNNATRALANVTVNGSAKPEDFKAAVGNVGNACKGCHDKFREK